MDSRNINSRDRGFISRRENSRLAKLEEMYQNPIERCRMTPHSAGRDAEYNVRYSIYGQRHPHLAELVGAYERGRQGYRQFERNRSDDWNEALARARQNPNNTTRIERGIVAASLYLPMRISGALARSYMPIKNLADQWDDSPADEARMAQTRRYMDLNREDWND